MINMFQLSTYNVKPVSSDSTLDAVFSPEGMFVISGNTQFSLSAGCCYVCCFCKLNI